MDKIFLVGIKGNGMSNLALILKKMGHEVLGCDEGEFFQTQEKLELEKITIFDYFSTSLLKIGFNQIIYSTAFENKEIVKKAKEDNLIKVFSYPEYLALLSKERNTYGVSGTHGKTTTTAAATYCLSCGKRKEFPFFSIFGSSIISQPSITFQGEDNLLLECCEYQDHFLLYSLRGIVITSIEKDHPDYFKNIEQMIQSYQKLILNVKKGGFVILNAEDPLVYELKNFIINNRSDLNIISYGFSSKAFISIEKDDLLGGVKLPILGYRNFDLPVKSDNLILDYLASAILSTCILLDRENPKLYLQEDSLVYEEAFITLLATSLNYLVDFVGVKRRLEYQGSYKQVTFIEDYAHHPSEIKTALEEVKKKYPKQKLLVVFTSHTASRTKALLDEFVDSLLSCDKLIITKTFSSARNDEDNFDWSKQLYKKLNKAMFSAFYGKLEAVTYVEDDSKLASVVSAMCEKNDICLTLGAANRSKLFEEVIKIL